MNGGLMSAGTMVQSELPFTVIPRGLLSGVSPGGTNPGRVTSNARPTPRPNFFSAARRVTDCAMDLVSSSNFVFTLFLLFDFSAFVLGLPSGIHLVREVRNSRGTLHSAPNERRMAGP